MPLNFRRNVVLVNASGDVLIGERFGLKGAWQFPQGGVKKKETLAEALAREVGEELGLSGDAYRVLSAHGPYRYRFSQNFHKDDYDGQEQFYFLALLTRPQARFRLDGDEQEFKSIRWIPPAAFRLDWVAPMKRGVYARVLRDIFGVFPRGVRTMDFH